MAIATEQELNTTRGKVLGGVASKSEMLRVFEALDEMELLLDEADEVDALGTEGWRHVIGWGD